MCIWLLRCPFVCKHAPVEKNQLFTAAAQKHSASPNCASLSSTTHAARLETFGQICGQLLPQMLGAKLYIEHFFIQEIAPPYRKLPPAEQVSSLQTRKERQGAGIKQKCTASAALFHLTSKFPQRFPNVSL